jgi:hypothetical protein
MTADLRIARAIREAGVRPEGAPRICCCRRCDRFPSIYPRDRHVRFNLPHLNLVR